MEELDSIDIARVERALQARQYAEAWERHHTPHSELGLKHHRARLKAEERVRDEQIVVLLKQALAEEVKERARHLQTGAQHRATNADDKEDERPAQQGEDAKDK